MLAALTPLVDPGPAAPVRTPAPTNPGRRVLQLAPGIWIVRFAYWQPASVLDHNADLPAPDGPEQLRQVLPLQDWLHEDWHAQAACRGMGEQLFFGDSPDERPTLKLSELAKARAVCRRCPVARDCLDRALTRPEKFGVWAGTSGRQRERMLLQIEAGWDKDALIDTWLSR